MAFRPLTYRAICLSTAGGQVLCAPILVCLKLFSFPTAFKSLSWPPSSPFLIPPAFYTAAPLTSAGILPVMQSLCPDGQRDEFGFLQYANST